MFGPSRELSETEQVVLDLLVDYAPVAVFQALNKKLNKQNVMISVTILEVN